MSYNFTTLTTVAACDAVITEANLEKSALEGRRSVLQSQINTSNATGGLQAQQNAEEENLAQIEATLLNLPEGKTRDRLLLSKHSSARRLEELNQRIQRVGPYQEDMWQIALGQLSARIAEYDVVITTIEAIRSSLPPDA